MRLAHLDPHNYFAAGVLRAPVPAVLGVARVQQQVQAAAGVRLRHGRAAHRLPRLSSCARCSRASTTCCSTPATCARTPPVRVRCPFRASTWEAHFNPNPDPKPDSSSRGQPTPAGECNPILNTSPTVTSIRSHPCPQPSTSPHPQKPTAASIIAADERPPARAAALWCVSGVVHVAVCILCIAAASVATTVRILLAARVVVHCSPPPRESHVFQWHPCAHDQLLSVCTSKFGDCYRQAEGDGRRGVAARALAAELNQHIGALVQEGSPCSLLRALCQGQGGVCLRL